MYNNLAMVYSKVMLGNLVNLFILLLPFFIFQGWFQDLLAYSFAKARLLVTIKIEARV